MYSFSQFFASKGNGILKVLFFLVVSSFAFFTHAEEIEVIEEVSDVEKVNFDKNLEDRLSRDILAYLNDRRYVLSVDSSLQKKATYLLTQPKSEQPPIQEKPRSQRTVVPNTIDILDSELPGLPSVPAPSKQIQEINQADESLNEEEFYFAPPIKTLVKSEVETKKIVIKLLLDNNVTAVQEAFLQNLITEKARLNVIRGDELIISKTEFPKTEEEVPEPEPEEPIVEVNETEPEIPPEPESDIWDTLLSWLPLVLLLLLMLGLFLWLRNAQKKNSEQILKQVQENEEARKQDMAEEKYRLSNLKFNKEGTSNEENQFKMFKEQIVLMALDNREVIDDYARKLVQGDDEISKASLLVLYNSMGPYQFKQLFAGRVMSKQQIDDLELYALEMNKEQNIEEQLPLLENIYQELLSLVNIEGESEAYGLAPFRFLSRLSNDKIHYLMNQESSKIKALILSQLSPDRASQLLSSLPAEDKSEVILEIADFQSMPMEAFTDIAADLSRKALEVPQINNISVDGLDVVLSMLEKMDSSSERLVLSQLEEENPALFQQIKRSHIGFSDLIKVPEIAMKTLFKEVDRGTIAISMYDVDEDFANQMFTHVNERTRLIIETELQEMSPPTSEEINEAKVKFTQHARSMMKAGLFSIEDMNIQEQAS